MNDPTGKGRYLGEGASAFAVWTDNAVQAGVGPVVPDLTYDPLPGIGGPVDSPPPAPDSPLVGIDFSVNTKEPT
jgi:hypothetical protein